MGCCSSRTPADIRQLPVTMDETKSQKVPYPTDSKQPFWTSDKTNTRTIRFAEEGIASEASCPPETIPRMFRKAVEKSGDKPALRAEVPGVPYDPDKGAKQTPSAPFEEWKTWTYKDYYDECHLAARSFISMGLEKYDGVTIYGFNCPQWVMSQNACIMAGGIAAGIYPSDTPLQVQFKASHSSSVIACCQASKAKMFVDLFQNGELPKLKAVVVWDEDCNEETFECKDKVLIKTSWKKMLEKAEAVDAQVVDKQIDEQQPGDVACLIYTSGTTGNPKAVMITHDNILFESLCAQSCLFDIDGEERIISYLPLSHVAGALVDIVLPIIVTAKQKGYVVAGFARVYDLSKGSFGDRLRCIKPTLFLGVPRVWEKIAEKIKAVGATVTGVKKKISTFCKGKGLEHARNTQLGGTGQYPSWYNFAESKVFTPVKAVLGLEHCKFAFTGAAPITTEVLEYFGALGLQINEVYGMSECTGATTWSSDNAHVWGSCGWTMPGTEVKVFKVDDADFNKKTECPPAKDIFNATEEEQGELCYRGRHIMAGYMANPDFGEEHVKQINDKNKSAIDDEGWLHSGDKGCCGENGMFKITGRYKELIIGSGGENIAPVPIEDNVKKLCGAISNIMMIGDKKKYNTAFVTLKAKGATGELPGGDDLDGEALNYVKGVTTISAASTNEAYIKQITDAIIATNNDGTIVPSNASKIQKFTILPADFSVETGELTPTLKLKRGAVMKDTRYSDILERLYAPENKKATYIPFDAVENEDAKSDEVAKTTTSLLPDADKGKDLEQTDDVPESGKEYTDVKSDDQA